MKRRGSVTIFLALMLSLILALVSAGITSVQMASARTQILNGMDIGLYSLFGQYDRKLLEEYDLFAVDGSCGGGMLNLSAVYDNLISYMEPVLKQNSQKLTLEQGGFTGYRLLTDDNGKAFYQQIVGYMKETLGSQGIQLLLGRMQERENKVQSAEEQGRKTQSGDSLNSYDSAMNQAAQESQAAEEAAKAENSAGGIQPPAVTSPAEPVENPITVIRRIMKMGILELVVPSGKGISSKEVEKGNLVSGRELQQGLPLPDGMEVDDSYAAKLLFQQYLMSRLGNFQQSAEGGLDYQMEYILAGKSSDMENLRSIAKKLLLVREGVNFACLAADSGKRAQIDALALAIASGFLVPPAAAAISAALMVCWSFAESVLDVRELLDGGKVPLVKTGADWQLSLENLPHLLEGLDSERRSSEGGMAYEDYLQIFLLGTGKEKKVMRAMDMVELNVRVAQERPDFRLDSCITALEASVDVEANKRKVYTVTKQYCYE